MDPQQRLLLELGYTSLHGSMHRRATLMGGDSGVFLGIERPEWVMVLPPSARGSVYAVTCENVSVAAGRTWRGAHFITNHCGHMAMWNYGHGKMSRTPTAEPGKVDGSHRCIYFSSALFGQLILRSEFFCRFAARFGAMTVHRGCCLGC